MRVEYESWAMYKNCYYEVNISLLDTDKNWKIISRNLFTIFISISFIYLNKLTNNVLWDLSIIILQLIFF